jgi:carboxypeptidase PM20D1
VLPQTAKAVINARLLPGDTDESLLADIRNAAKKLKIDAGAKVLRYSPAPRETPSDTAVFRLLGGLTKEIHGGMPLPYLVTGATDSREYAGVADEIYRFYPFAMTFEELDSMHGTNERIKCSSMLEAVTFITRFIENAAGEDMI